MRGLVGLVVCILLITGCTYYIVPLTTFQGGDVMDKGEMCMGIGGAGMYYEGELQEFYEIDLYQRFGLGWGDIGFRVFGHNVDIYGGQLNVKIPWFKGSVPVSLDLGVWQAREVIGGCPALLIGTKRLYGGVKVFTEFAGDDDMPSIVSGFVGGSWEHRCGVGVIPELSFHVWKRDSDFQVMFLFGLGLQYSTSSRD